MRVAVAQMEPKLGESERNLDVGLGRLEEAVAAGAELLVLPECAIPGYMFGSLEEAMPYAEEIPGPSTDALEAACRRLGVHVVCGVEKARDKDYVIPGEYELYLFGDRRPELYGALVEEMQPIKT